MDEELKKLFMTIPDSYGKFSAIIQVSGLIQKNKHMNIYISITKSKKKKF